jgi:hypothetical protein
VLALTAEGVASRARRVLSLGLQPAESIVVTFAKGVTHAAITMRTWPACLAEHFQRDHSHHWR